MFNPQARWDRDLPGGARLKREAVEVIACFRAGKVRPLSFTVGGCSLTVARINFSWTERKGRALVYYFSVSDSCDQYRLCLDTEAMSWYLLSG